MQVTTQNTISTQQQHDQLDHHRCLFSFPSNGFNFASRSHYLSITHFSILYCLLPQWPKPEEISKRPAASSLIYRPSGHARNHLLVYSQGWGLTHRITSRKYQVVSLLHTINYHKQIQIITRSARASQSQRQ